MIDLFKEFFKENSVGDGVLITEVKYQCFEKSKSGKNYMSKVVEDNKWFAEFSCSGYIDNRIAETLTLQLIKNPMPKASIEIDNISDVGDFWHKFSKEEVRNFSYIVGDENSIHFTENPVVQGLLILNKLYETIQTDEIEVRFMKPVYSNNSVYLKYEEGIVKGFSNGILCFLMKMVNL